MLKRIKNFNFNQKKYAIESALLLGFQTESAKFPIMEEMGTIGIPENEEQLKALWKPAVKGIRKVPEKDRKASGFWESVNMDFRDQQGLECMFQRGPFLKDEDQDLLPDRLDVKIILPEDAEDSMVVAACNFAFRFGMETTGYEGGILAEDSYTGNGLVFETSERTEMVLKEENGVTRVYVRGQGRELEEFSAKVCETFPKVDNWRTWREFLLDMTDDMAMRSPDGQLAYLAAKKKEQEGIYEAFVSPDMNQEAKTAFTGVDFHNYKAGKAVYEKTYEYPWEVDVFETILSTQVYPYLKTGDQIQIFGALSEDQKVRSKVVSRLQKGIQDAGAVLEKAEVICAYKQGFSWLEEVVVPQVKGRQIDQVEIYFKPFLPEGETEWIDENGAVPVRHTVAADHPDKWYDLPIRYLQELYPIEDVLVKELGVQREQVVFLPYEGTESLTYICNVRAGGEIVFSETYEAHWSQRPYLDAFPNLGKVHPATGYIKVFQNGNLLLEKQIPTDLERIWDTYQKEVLTDCAEYVLKKTGGVLGEDLQPFFHQLHLDVTVSEPDLRVGCREDLISSLDALHEDMYFAGADYFKYLGLAKTGTVLDAPGLILPDIHQAEGKPVMKVTLLEQEKERPEIYCDGKLVCASMKQEAVHVMITKVSYENGEITVHVTAKGAEASVLQAYAQLFEEGILSNSHRLEHCHRIVLESETGQSFAAVVPAQKVTAKNKSITEIDLHENELIGYETYLEIMEELKQVPGIEVFRTAVSYAGREQYAIWLAPEYEGYLSMTKYLTNRPSELINARHHANEVSSTNGIFILLKKLLTEEKYRGLGEELSLVMVPMENVDGAAIHYELQKEHPYWKFHVARFNALGKEFFRDSFKKVTIHTEAMGHSRIYERFAPDVIVDNHGVPSHEWEQQFSGYTSPSYKGFWLPRSLLYGYFWYVTDDVYHGNYLVNKKMEDVIADQIAESAEMTALNLEWSGQFEKYAHRWLPKLFPADYYKNMINYWIPYTAAPDNSYPAARFPWITTVSYTSEVADETAQGAYLNLCARAHVAHDEAIIALLRSAEHVYECGYDCQQNQIFAKYFRRRPMVV